MNALDELARGQQGLVTRTQAVELLGTSSFRHAVANQRLIRVGTGVYRCLGAPPSFRQRALSACLAIGPPMAVSHRTAAVLWGYEAVAPGPLVEVSVPTGRSGRQSGIRTYRRALPDADIHLRYGIAVTCPGRTLLDLAVTMGADVPERCVDDALRARQATAGELLAWLRGQGEPRRGGPRLRRILELRAGSGVGDSAGVDRVNRWIARSGLPAPVLSLALVVAGRPRVVDLAYPAEKVAVEFNGWEYHQMRSRMDDDHARTTELELAGWLVIVVTAAHSEAETIDRIARALARRAGEARSGLLGR